MFHNLKSYDSNLIFKEVSKFDVRMSVIPNGLEKYMPFSLNNLIFIDSILFMNSSLDKLVKNLNSEDFKYLSEEFRREKVELVPKKRVFILMSILIVLKNLKKVSCLILINSLVQ